MSLAEDLRRPLDAAGARDPGLRQPTRRVPVEAPRASTAVVKDLRDARKPGAVAVDPTGDSLALLDRAAKSIVFLLGRYRQLEEHVRQLDAWSKAQLQAAEAAAQRWQESAVDNERKLQELQRSQDALVRRAETAEQALKRDRDTLTALQDRIISAFGFGSEAHDALSSIELE